MMSALRLEVMRDILRELYCARNLLRRRLVNRKHVPGAPLRVKKAWEFGSTRWLTMLR